MEAALNLIESSLLQPSAAIGHYAGARLKELRPDKAILECTGCGFDLDGFIDAGHATLIPLADFGHNQIVINWRGCPTEEGVGMRPPFASCNTGEEGIARKVLNGFVRLEWRGKTLEALRLRWMEMMSLQHACFLVAESEAVAEAFYTEVCEWSAMPHGEVLVFEQGTWRKDRHLFAAIQLSSFANLVLVPGLKESLREDVAQFFSRAEVYSRYCVPWKRGILLVGPPGNGKTHAVKALCHEIGVPALYVRSLEPQGMFHGSEHANISSVFDLARKTAPCLLILEDLDALIKPGNRSFVLNELDGFAANTGICVVATTNYPERLDASILERPSRFDRKYLFELPQLAERIAYLEMWSGQQSTELRLTTAGIQAVGQASNGFSFAYLKELCLSAVMAWMNSGGKTPMDAVAAAQTELLASQMRSPGGDSDGNSTDGQLTPRERFHKLMRGEAP
jgi:ATPase family associated with various cellular activities (AAA)